MEQPTEPMKSRAQMVVDHKLDVANSRTVTMEAIVPEGREGNQPTQLP
jgi:hypothetical protein